MLSNKFFLLSYVYVCSLLQTEQSFRTNIFLSPLPLRKLNLKSTASKQETLPSNERPNPGVVGNLKGVGISTKGGGL